MVSRKRWSKTCAVGLAALIVSCWAGRVVADEPTTTLAPKETARPWAEGVTEERKESALDLLKRGNQLLKDSDFKGAAARYREALSVWDHPGIHYNLALALLNLDQFMEAHAELEKAVTFGPAPLEADKFEHARRYLTLVEKQLASVDIRCDVPGADVSMDGRLLFHAPGRHSGFVRPGPHSVLAAKPGFPTTERNRVLVAGENTVFQLGVYADGELIGYRRRWPLWKPIAVTLGGAALLGAGVLLTYESRNEFRSYDRQIQEQCSPGGCATDPAHSTKRRAEIFQTAAIASYVGGGAVLGAGIVLLIMDRAVPYRKVPQPENVAFAAPFVGPDSAGVTIGGRF